MQNCQAEEESTPSSSVPMEKRVSRSKMKRRKTGKRKVVDRNNLLIRRHLGKARTSISRRDPARKVGMGLIHLVESRKYIDSLSKVKRKLEIIKKRYRAEIIRQSKRLSSLKREVALLELILNNREPIKAFFKTICWNSVGTETETQAPRVESETVTSFKKDLSATDSDDSQLP